MYITVADKVSIQTRRMSTIDELFAGLEPDIIDDEVVYEPGKVLRTKTFQANEYELKRDTYNQLISLGNKFQSIVALHPKPEEEYRTFRIPKKTHGYREINAPEPALKIAQKTIADALLYKLKILPHDSAWAYTKGRDVVGAMKEHQHNKSRWYLKIDLHDFFGSCNAAFIRRQLISIYPFAAFKEPNRTNLIDYIIHMAMRNDGLPQGTPLSPVLTNLIMVPFDYNINRLLNKLSNDETIYKQRYVYTRYADDMIISAKCSFDYKIIIDELKRLFNGTPLVINEEKTRYGSSAGRNWNLGIMCNKDNKLTVGYKRKQHLKSIIYNYINATDRWTLEDLRWLLGEIAWITNVEPDYMEGLMTYFNNKYHLDVKNKIILDIKYYNN